MSYFHDSAAITRKEVVPGVFLRTMWGDKIMMSLVEVSPGAVMPIHSHPHEQTGMMMVGLEKIFVDQNPDLVVVVGDVNSTLAGALAAAKLNLPVAHVEAGLRSYDRTMPEEINRLLTDAISDMIDAST